MGETPRMSKPSSKEILEARDVMGGRLALKREMRINDRRVSILTIPRFRRDALPAMRPGCPKHKFWSVIRTSHAHGVFLIDSIRSGCLNRILTASTMTASIPGAPLYSLNGLRRCCATEVGRTGSTLVTIWGICGAAGRRFYKLSSST